MHFVFILSLQTNETHSSGASYYLYGKLIQETCSYRYSGDLTETGLVIVRIYSTML